MRAGTETRARGCLLCRSAGCCCVVDCTTGVASVLLFFPLPARQPHTRCCLAAESQAALLPAHATNRCCRRSRNQSLLQEAIDVIRSVLTLGMDKAVSGVRVDRSGNVIKPPHSNGKKGSGGEGGGGGSGGGKAQGGGKAPAAKKQKKAAAAGEEAAATVVAAAEHVQAAAAAQQPAAAMAEAR